MDEKAEFPSEKVLIAYEKRGNTENYIKEVKYDMAVGQALLQLFWTKEAIFQLMMRHYNLFCFSRWTLQMERNTDSKSKRSG